MRVLLETGLIILVLLIGLNYARKGRNASETLKDIEKYGYSDPHIESSIDYYGENYEPCNEGQCKDKTFITAALVIPELLLGSYFLLSALYCALFNTCSSYPTVTFTTSVTVTNTLTTTTTTPSTTTTRTSTTSPVTKTSVRKTKSTTILPTTFTSISIIKFRTSTTTFPTTTKTTTSTTPTTTTTTPISLTVTDTTTTSTSTRTQSNNGNGRGLVDLDNAFWREILHSEDEQDAINPSEIMGTFEMTESFKEVSSAAFVHEDTWTTEVISSFVTSGMSLTSSFAETTASAREYSDNAYD